VRFANLHFLRTKTFDIAVQGVLIVRWNCIEWGKTMMDWCLNSPLVVEEAEQLFSVLEEEGGGLELRGEVGRKDTVVAAGTAGVDIVAVVMMMMGETLLWGRDICLKCSLSHARLTRQRNGRCSSTAVLADERLLLWQSPSVGSVSRSTQQGNRRVAFISLQPPISPSCRVLDD